MVEETDDDQKEKIEEVRFHFNLNFVLEFSYRQTFSLTKTIDFHVMSGKGDSSFRPYLHPISLYILERTDQLIQGSFGRGWKTGRYNDHRSIL